MRNLPSIAVLLLLVVAACRREDGGLEKYRQASEQYQALLAQGRPAADPAFDQVLELLEGVSPQSSAHERAQVLRQALLGARQHLPPRALVEKGARTAAEPSALRSRCEELARKLGAATPEERPSVSQALWECRRAVLTQEKHEHTYIP